MNAGDLEEIALSLEVLKIDLEIFGEGLTDRSYRYFLKQYYQVMEYYLEAFQERYNHEPRFF